MTRRDLVVVAVLVVLLAVVGGALALPRSAPVATAPEPTARPTLPPPATYREGVVGVPESITPLTARSRAERTLVGLVFSGLVRVGVDGRLEPDLAASWSVDDAGTTWTFLIRDDAAWQDGVPVTADDVVFTVRALKSPEAAGAAAASWAEVTATAVDERTVRFTLETPLGGFLAAATQPLLPVHLLGDVPFEDLAADAFGEAPVGTGPFVLTELDAERAVLVPTALAAPPQDPGSDVATDSLASPALPPTLALPIPYLERIEVRFLADDDALATAFRAGELDGVAGLPPSSATELAAGPGATAVRYPTTTLASVFLDLRPDHPELRDARTRRALLAAIDREALVARVLEGAATRADALVPPDSWAFDAASAAPVTFDAKAAGRLLTEAGWTKKAGTWIAPRAKDPYQLEILTVPEDANPRLAAIAGAVRDAWSSLGLNVTLTHLPAAELATRLRGGTFTAAVVEVAFGVEPDLYPLLASSQVRGSGSNFAGYQDTALDPLLEKARGQGTADERVAAWKAVLAALAERQPILPLAWEQEVVVIRGVAGMTPHLIADPGDRFGDVLAWRLAADR